MKEILGKEKNTTFKKEGCKPIRACVLLFWLLAVGFSYVNACAIGSFFLWRNRHKSVILGTSRQMEAVDRRCLRLTDEKSSVRRGKEHTVGKLRVRFIYRFNAMLGVAKDHIPLALIKRGKMLAVRYIRAACQLVLACGRGSEFSRWDEFFAS